MDKEARVPALARKLVLLMLAAGYGPENEWQQTQGRKKKRRGTVMRGERGHRKL